ncbi:unnamed protein product, partial [Dovyalis caffra]
ETASKPSEGLSMEHDPVTTRLLSALLTKFKTQYKSPRAKTTTRKEQAHKRPDLDSLK